MKRYSAFASIFVLLAVLIFTPYSRVSAAEATADGMTKVLTKGDLSFYANAENGEVALINTESGISWKSNPDFSDADGRLGNGQKRLMGAQLEILYYDTNNSPQERNSAVASVAKGGLSFSKTEKGCRFVYDFPEDETVNHRAAQFTSEFTAMMLWHLPTVWLRSGKICSSRFSESVKTETACLRWLKAETGLLT